MPTCKTFDTRFIYRQWKEAQWLYERWFEKKEDHASACRNWGQRKQILVGSCWPKVCFYLSQGGNRRGQYIIRDICDLDYIHNHKKMLNPLDHATKALILGDYMVHMNYIKRAYHVFSPMGACDINCHDRQNWRSVQKLSFLKVRDCLMEFIDSSAPNQRPNPMFLGMQVLYLPTLMP